MLPALLLLGATSAPTGETGDGALGGAGATGFDFTTAAAPTCDSGTCVAGR